MQNNDWLKELKAGDKVIVVSGLHTVCRTVETVEKSTSTQIVLPRDVRYRKSNGDRIGRNRWHRDELEEATPEAVAEVEAATRRANLAYKMESTKWRELSTAKLERIAAILSEPEPAGVESTEDKL